jgi:hypothetical protein
MHHPRRNEVFRDVGSYPHSPDDARFIEIRRFAFRPDAALLLCSDGLSDLIKSVEMTRILEQYDGDATKIAQLLVEAANAAGGRDNISVVFVPGPEFLGTDSATLAEGRNRHATTRMRTGKTGTRGFFRNLLLLATGMLLMLGIWFAYDRYSAKPAPPIVMATPAHIPREILVDAQNPHGIASALAEALPGDSILVPAGEYLGPLALKERVNVVAQSAHHVIVHTDPEALNDPGIAVVARGVRDARVKGLHLEGDEKHPLRTGLLIADSSIEAEDIEVSGASECGVKIEGESHPLVMASNFHSNSGPGVIVKGQSAPRVMDNRIADNGHVTGAPRSGIEIGNEAQPTLLHNEILHNGLPAVFPLALDEEIRAKNIVDPAPAGKSVAKPHTPPAHTTTPNKPEMKPNAIGHPAKPVTDA